MSQTASPRSLARRLARLTPPTIPDTTDPAHYALGRSMDEARRLMLQHRIYGSATRKLFEAAGISTGMRVLDVGSGAGDVALLLADLVGPTGEVVGVEIAPESIALATERASDEGVASFVRFVAADLRDLALDVCEPSESSSERTILHGEPSESSSERTILHGEPSESSSERTIQHGEPSESSSERTMRLGTFDAVVGRWVLMYQPDPVALLRRLAGMLRPGGILAFQESDLLAMHRPYPPAPLHEQLYAWMQPPTDSGVEQRMGPKLFPSFVAAGLPDPAVRIDTPVGGGPDWVGYEYVAATTRSLLPMLSMLGIVDVREIDVDSLADRLRDEIVDNHGVQPLASVYGAWVRVP